MQQNMIWRLLGFQCITRSLCRRWVKVSNHCLGCGGVRREEPHAVHPTEMREKRISHLVIVTITTNDVTCVMRVPLFRK